MVLQVVNEDTFKDIRIEEGEMFLLPDTIGIVMERERPEGSIESFHCTDLGSQLKPVIMKWQQF
ncbi:hypothetical protein MPER_02029 [Moniliophthora perniciosa FA553]|nr:hypothetical protein MPER_02029 [Moniliophthora perniciosa FA553]